MIIGCWDNSLILRSTFQERASYLTINKLGPLTLYYSHHPTTQDSSVYDNVHTYLLIQSQEQSTPCLVVLLRNLHFNLARPSYENEPVTRAAAFLVPYTGRSILGNELRRRRVAETGPISFADGLRRRGVDGMFAAAKKESSRLRMVSNTFSVGKDSRKKEKKKKCTVSMSCQVRRPSPEER